jgi:hypothetical protein
MGGRGRKGAELKLIPTTEKKYGLLDLLLLD